MKFGITLLRGVYMKLKNKIIFTAGALGAAVLLVNSVMNNKAASDIIIPQGFTVTAHTGCEGTKDNSLDAITLGYGCGADIVDLHRRSIRRL